MSYKMAPAPQRGCTVAAPVPGSGVKHQPPPLPRFAGFLCAFCSRGHDSINQRAGFLLKDCESSVNWTIVTGESPGFFLPWRLHWRLCVYVCGVERSDMGRQDAYIYAGCYFKLLLPLFFTQSSQKWNHDGSHSCHWSAVLPSVCLYVPHWVFT